MFLYRITLITLASILLTACTIGAAPAPIERDNMSISSTERIIYSADRALSKSLSVGEVTGGREKDSVSFAPYIDSEVFAAALRDSLETAKLLNSRALSTYVLDAQLIDVKQKMKTWQVTAVVSTNVKYTLRDKDSGAVALQKTIDATASVKLREVYDGMKRMQTASERSAQANIKKMIDLLYNYRP